MSKRIAILLVMALVLSLVAGVPASADHPDDGVSDGSGLHPADTSVALVEHDATTAMVEGLVSDGPNAKVVKNLDLVGRGDRLVTDATTDVWAHNGYAYTGTFQNPCGGDPEAGVWVWDVGNKTKPSFVTVIPSPAGSRSNDVRVATMNSGDILVHSNEPCNGGPGGFEVYNVDDPENPVFLASVQTDDVNLFLQENFGFTDFGVHNLWLFSQGENDYVAATVESLFGNFQIFDITDPNDIQRVGFWGAEQSPNAVANGVPAGVDWVNTDDFVGVILPGNAYNNDGFGASTNRFLHDVTISADGTRAYLANWDEGLVLLDISDPTNPTWISTAIDVANGSLDGEVNSHSVWPSEDGTIVVEGEEDFAPFESTFTIDSGPNAGEYPSAEGAITVPIFTLPGQVMTGPTTYVGLACDGGDPVPTGTGIALIQRGVCTFSSKINNAEAAGYSGVVVFNDAARGDALVSMGGTATNLPGVFVGHSTGLAIAKVPDAASLVIGRAGETVSATAVPNAWSGLRIWDYSDPSAPVLASLFDTVCSANPIDPSCDPAGTYSVHNVQVETLGNKVLAYVSWYTDGMLVLDVSDPYNPVEVARYFDNSEDFIAGNGGNPHDFWGVYKETNSPFFYGSDRNGGLRIFKLKGSGSEGNGAGKKP